MVVVICLSYAEGATVYGHNNNTISSYDTTTGAMINSFSSHLYAASDLTFGPDGYLYAINLDGTLKWKFNIGKGTNSSPAIGSDGTIYVGSHDRNLYAIYPNGSLKWTYTFGNYISPVSLPVIDEDGTIYISEIKRIYWV